MRASKIYDPARLGQAIGLLLAILSNVTAHGQWIEQTVTLKPGWNSVYLDLQPVPDDVDAVLAGLPVESAWQWNGAAKRLDFVRDPALLVPEDPEWLTYLPASSPQASVRNMLRVRGGNGLLIKLSGSQSVTWRVSGRPVLGSDEWVPDSYNFVGCHLAPDSKHSFASYFAGSPAHAAMTVLTLTDAGTWKTIEGAALTTEKPEKGRGYWIRINGSSSFKGPIEVASDQGTSLDFGALRAEGRVTLLNRGAVPRTLTMTQVDSLAAPNGYPAIVGSVPLEYWSFDTTPDENGQATAVVSWQALGGWKGAGVAGGASVSLRLAPNRNAMTKPLSGAATSAVYGTLLQVEDGLGSRVLLPVSAKRAVGISLGGAEATQRALQAETGTAGSRAGLWVGLVSADAVNFASSPSDRESTLPTSRSFDFRILIHLDGAGRARLLQRALVLWKDGVGTTPGRYGLFTSESHALASGFSGTIVRDGVAMPRRFSAPAFGFKEPILMDSTGAFGDGFLRCKVLIGFDDPLNPFVHRFHPDHDNLDEQDPPQPLGAGVESFDITRTLELTFSAEDPSGSKLPGWGDTRLGGTYRETIEGVHAVPLHVAGTFLLSRATPVAALNQ